MLKLDRWIISTFWLEKRQHVEFHCQKVSSMCESLASTTNKTFLLCHIHVVLTKNRKRLTGPEYSKRPSRPCVADVTIASTNISISIVAIASPFLEDQAQWYVAMFKGFCWWLLSTNRRRYCSGEEQKWQHCRKTNVCQDQVQISVFY